MLYEENKGKKTYNLAEEIYRSLMEGSFVTLFFNIAHCDDEDPFRYDKILNVMAFICLGQLIGCVLAEASLVAIQKWCKPHYEQPLPVKNYLSKFLMCGLLPAVMTGFSWYGVSLVSEKAVGIEPHCNPADDSAKRIISSCIILGLVQAFVEMGSLTGGKKIHRYFFPRQSEYPPFLSVDEINDYSEQRHRPFYYKFIKKCLKLLRRLPWHEGFRVATLEAASYGSQYITVGADKDPQYLISTAWTIVCIVPGIALEFCLLAFLSKEANSLEKFLDHHYEEHDYSLMLTDNNRVQIEEVKDDEKELSLPRLSP